MTRDDPLAGASCWITSGDSVAMRESKWPGLWPYSVLLTYPIPSPLGWARQTDGPSGRNIYVNSLKQAQRAGCLPSPVRRTGFRAPKSPHRAEGPAVCGLFEVRFSGSSRNVATNSCTLIYYGIDEIGNLPFLLPRQIGRRFGDPPGGVVPKKMSLYPMRIGCATGFLNTRNPKGQTTSRPKSSPAPRNAQKPGGGASS
jgi:hypothetical protein